MKEEDYNNFISTSIKKNVIIINNDIEILIKIRQNGILKSIIFYNENLVYFLYDIID